MTGRKGNVEEHRLDDRSKIREMRDITAEYIRKGQDGG